MALRTEFQHESRSLCGMSNSFVKRYVGDTDMLQIVAEVCTTAHRELGRATVDVQEQNFQLILCIFSVIS